MSTHKTLKREESLKKAFRLLENVDVLRGQDQEDLDEAVQMLKDLTGYKE